MLDKILTSRVERFALLLFAILLLTDPTSAGIGRRPRQYRAGRPNKLKWWERTAIAKGPNMCATEKLFGSPRRFGRPWTGGHICGTPSMVIFACCEGYGTLPGEPGCSVGKYNLPDCTTLYGNIMINVPVKPLTNVFETISRNGATILDEVIRATTLKETLSKDGPFTLFAPTNQAFENVSETTMMAFNKTATRNSKTISLLYYHVIDGRIGEKDFQDGTLLPTLYHRQPLRINKFRTGLLTVNCIPLVQVNHEATNGIVHTIEDILLPPVQNTIADVILQDAQFSRLATALVKAKLTSLLREQRSWTVFAPTNEAFDSIARQDYEATFADPDALIALLHYHILPVIWCSCSVVSESSLRTLEGTRLRVSCNNSVTYINDAALIKGDIMATNGFINVIDKVLFPKSAKSLLQILEDLKLYEILSLIPTSGLQNTFINGAKFTIFAPSDEVIKTLSNETLKALKASPAAIYGILVGHMVTGKYRTSNLADKQTLPTLAQMHPLQVNIYPQRILIDGGVITNPNNEGRNGVVHVIDKVLLPPTSTVGNFLQERMDMRIFVKAMNYTTTRLLDELTNGKGPYTVFAPDDSAFDSLPYFTLDRMLMDEAILTTVMTNHLIDEQIFMKALLPKAYYQYRTRHNHNFKIREDTGTITAGIAIVKEADIFCTNGVVHIINRVIQLN